MLKRIFNLSSPVGIALTVAGVVLALSPEARRVTRQALVKGTSLLLGAMDSAKSATAGLAAGVSESTAKLSGMLEEVKDSAMETMREDEDLVRGAAIDSGISENRPEIH
ncbi:hypothetical protein [Effusibacillus consociatus]|uniref:DUF5132 domain-containing protein n=1 Tax=Effusibacillus consociatus TaxID=1117041 RepID=A0ABV9Q1A4_9BACL